MTSSPTVAIAAAVLGTPFRISFGGATLFQYAEDVAKTLLIASRADPDGPRVFNLGGSAVAIDDWISAIDGVVPGARDLVTFEPKPLPFPSDIQHDGIAALGAVPVTPYEEAIAATAAIYQGMAAEGRLVGSEQGVPTAAPAAAAATPTAAVSSSASRSSP
jgi:nucleoside-diphosphate-sugar epimerase